MLRPTPPNLWGRPPNVRGGPPKARGVTLKARRASANVRGGVPKVSEAVPKAWGGRPNVHMQMSGDEDCRLKTVMDPCVGTGRMILHASNYSYRLYAQDINPTVLKACLVNGYCFAPWLVRPFPFLADLPEEDVSQPVTTPPTEPPSGPAPIRDRKSVV